MLIIKNDVMRKILLLFISFVFVSISMQAQVPVTGVTLNHDTIVLGVGCDTTLFVTVTPNDAANDSVVWNMTNTNPSDNEVYAQIDTTTRTTAGNYKMCIVRGLRVGETKVSATALYGDDSGNDTDTCVIKVIQLVEKVELNKKTLNLNKGQDSVLIATVSPQDAFDKSLIWVSRDPLIVSLTSTTENNEIKITAEEVGETWIVAETVDGGFQDSCFVKVYEPIAGFSLNKDSIDLFVGEDTIVIAQILPLLETNKSVIWVIANNSGNYIDTIAPIGNDAICRIIAQNAGEAKIIATTYDGLLKDTCVITVKNVPVPVTGMSLNKDSLTLKINADTVALAATILPSDATNDSIIWISTDSTTVNITAPASNKYDLSCKIKALKSGTAKIIAKTVDGGFLDTCVVTVVVPVESIVLTSTRMSTQFGTERLSMNLKNDTTAVIEARVYPENATDKSLTWRIFSPANTVIDSIPASYKDTVCHIKALRSGTDTIIAVSAEGVQSRWCYIDIPFREVDSVKINKGTSVVNDTMEMKVNTAITLVTGIFPANATNDTLRVTSTNSEIVVIDSLSTGVYLRALKKGTAIVYVSPTDGYNGKKDSCIIEVRNNLVESISINKDTVFIFEQQIDSVLATIKPSNATNDSIVWTSSKSSVVSISPVRYDSVCSFKGLTADTALIYAVSKENNTIKDSCVIVVKKQFIFLDSDTVSASKDGIIEFSLLLSSDAVLTGSFRLELPKGFILAMQDGKYKTDLTERFKETSILSIILLNDSTYIFNILAKPTSSSVKLRAGERDTVKVMDIAYTVVDEALKKSTDIFDAKFVNIELYESGNLVAKEEKVTVKITSFDDPTANEVFAGDGSLSVYMNNNRLYVDTDKAETIYVYSLNGGLIFTGDKPEGKMVFNINTPEKVLIVRGSSGWANKVFNK